MIAVDPVFNESSVSPPAVDERQARDRMAGTIDILARMPDYGLGKSLRVSNEFHLLELAQGYTVSVWISDRQVDRDHLRFFLSLAAKAPFIRPEDGDALDHLEHTEVAFQGQSNPAFVAAYSLDAPLVSLDHDVWEEPDLPATVILLDGEGELSEEDISLVNFARLGHFDHHASWFARRKAATDIADLWSRRAELFPHLVFCETIEEQLAQQTPILSQIVARLEDMERVAAIGHPFDNEAFGRKCNATSSPTFATYGKRYDFRAPDGSQKRCGWHFYLPGGRRIYFSSDYTIGHIGNHLPTVKYP